MTLFYSTLDPQYRVPLKEAVVKGLAPGKGLFMPEVIPAMPASFFEALPQLTLQETGIQVLRQLLGDAVPAPDLQEMVEQALNFPIPLVPLTDRLGILELFHGPTLAFKDVAARFMARLLAYVRRGEDEELTIIVATSGDTGGAVAWGFAGVPGIQVVVLYPSGKVSPLQEQQITTVGGNVRAIEVDGTFDDCQAMVKAALADPELNQHKAITTANSINIARLLPQTVYYFHAYAQVPDRNLPVAMCVPSGNFGNLTAGIIAQRMGLPMRHYIAATNANDVVPRYLRDGDFEVRPTIKTISNAMDVSLPSNFDRINNLFAGEHAQISQAMHGYAFTDHQTRDAMRQVLKTYDYMLDPHGAVAYLGALAFRDQFDGYTIFQETAHPSKFKEVVEEAVGRPVPVPSRLAACMEKPKQAVPMSPQASELIAFLRG